MSILGFARAFLEVVPYRHMPFKLQQYIQNKRLREITEYARCHSVYYGERIPENWNNLEEIRPTTKADLIAHFDEIMTDKRITMDMIRRQIEEDPNNGSLFDGEYIIAMTSGSSGYPTVIIQDHVSMDRDSLSSTFRGLHFKFPFATITDATGYGVETERLRQNSERSAFVNRMLSSIDATKHPKDILEELEAAHPNTIIGYTSVIRLAAAEAIKKKTTLCPKQIFCSGELLSASDRKLIETAFPTAFVGSLYASTEGGVIAEPCKYGHLHLNSDLVKLEPVDENNQPVPYGVTSAKALLTHLGNHVQPLIRFEIDDRITMHQGCSCGIKDDWIEIEGRADDLLPFETSEGTVYVSPMNLIVLLDEFSMEGLEKFKNYQVLCHKDNRLELRLDFWDNSMKERVFDEVKVLLEEYFTNYGIDHITIVLSEDLPQRTSARGKQKRIFVVKE